MLYYDLWLKKFKIITKVILLDEYCRILKLNKPLLNEYYKSVEKYIYIQSTYLCGGQYTEQLNIGFKIYVSENRI